MHISGRLRILVAFLLAVGLVVYPASRSEALAGERYLGYSRRMSRPSNAVLSYAVARLDELPAGEMLRVEIADEEIVLFHTPDGVFATDDFCSHKRIRLSIGFLEGNVIECPLDGGTFSGKPIQAPCRRAVRTHPVQVDGDTILLGLAR
jgi:nitrite reductase/ring-hydroxylating ferredoxin subunit